MIEKARLAVVVDEAGDPDSSRPGSIARRYGSEPGTFEVEQGYAVEASNASTMATERSSTTVVLDVEGDVDKLKSDIAREPYVLSVTER